MCARPRMSSRRLACGGRSISRTSGGVSSTCRNSICPLPRRARAVRRLAAPYPRAQRVARVGSVSDAQRVPHRDRLLASFSRRSRSLAGRLRRRLLTSTTRVLLMRRMTEEELFRFDLEGYLVVKQVLPAEDVAALSAIAAHKCPLDRSAYHREFGASAWGRPYQALIDHPKIVPYLLDVLG